MRVIWPRQLFRWRNKSAVTFITFIFPRSIQFCAWRFCVWGSSRFSDRRRIARPRWWSLGVSRLGFRGWTCRISHLWGPGRRLRRRGSCRGLLFPAQNNGIITPDGKKQSLYWFCYDSCDKKWCRTRYVTYGVKIPKMLATVKPIEYPVCRKQVG